MDGRRLCIRIRDGTRGTSASIIGIVVVIVVIVVIGGVIVVVVGSLFLVNGFWDEVSGCLEDWNTQVWIMFHFFLEFDITSDFTYVFHDEINTGLR